MTGRKKTCFFLLLAVFWSPCVSSDVEFAWKPYNLTATVLGGENGYTSLEITWFPGECAEFDTSTISLIDGEVVRNQSVRTSAGSVTFDQCEYWTQYEIVLQAGVACFDERIQISEETGPGQPHKPEGAIFDVHDTSVDFSIVEAAMPREIRGYLMQLCQTGKEGTGNKCQPQTFINHTGTDGFQNGSLTSLQPESDYSLKLTPVIIYGPTRYNGDTFSGSFRTHGSVYPKGINATVEFEEKKSTLTAAFTWKVSKSIYPVKRFEVTLEPCSDNCSKFVDDTVAEFTNVRFGTNTTLSVSAIFEVSGKTIQTTSKFTFASPDYIAPLEAVEVAKISPSDVFVGWNFTEPSSKYDVTWCLSGNCSQQSVETPEIHLTSLEPASNYSIGIVVLRENFKAEVFSGSLQTLIRDYESPHNLSAIPVTKESNSVSYKFGFSISSEPSSFELEACNSENNCQRNVTKNIHEALLNLKYFAIYNFTVSAVYALPLNKRVAKSNSSNLSTIGTVPDPVTFVVPFNITDNSVELRWKPPRNVPPSVKIVYEVATKWLNQTTSNSSIRLSDLKPFTGYDVNVRANVSYLGTTYLGAVADRLFKTDVGKPGVVRNITVGQQNYSAEVTVEWTPPDITNGPLDYYVVEYQTLASKNGASSRHVNGTRTNFTLPVTQNDTLYEFRVTGVNLNLQKQEVVGDSAQVQVSVRGVDLFFNVSVVNRTAHSLRFLLALSNGNEGSPKPFYLITDYTNRTYNTSEKFFTVDGLRSFTNETLRIQACFNTRFCTEKIAFTALTNVGVPSAVSNLTLTVVNRTNLALHWEAPKDKNGPVNGYLVELIDESDMSSTLNFIVRSQTSWSFNTTVEYEMYNIVVKAFNTDLDDPTKEVYGESASKKTETSGFSVPKPENFRVEDANATTASITWEKPADDKRFNVAWYFVEVTDPKREGFFTQDKSTVIRNLEPYKNFTVEIRGCTGQTTSKDCGQPRTTRNITDTAAPGEPKNLRAKPLDEHSAEISWEAPLIPNGPIDGYILTIRNSTNEVTLDFNSSVLALKINGLNPDETQTLSLIAFNENRHLGRLDSIQISTEFSTAEPTRYWIWIVVVSVVTLLSGAVLAVFIYRRRRAQSEGGYAPIISSESI